MSYYLQNARIVKPGGRQALEDAVVVVEDDLITYAGDPQMAPHIPDGAEVIDLGGRIIMPGLVNAHAHSPMTLFRGTADDMPLYKWLNDRIWPLEEHLDEEAVYWGSMLAIAEMIGGGVCAFNDMYFMTEQTLRAVEHAHIRATLPIAMACQSEDRDAITDKLQPAIAFFENYHNKANGRIHVTLAPHAEYTCSPAFLRECGVQAKRLGADIHIHISETLDEHEACKKRYKKTPIQLMASLGVLDVPVLAAHCVYVEDEDIRIMADNGVTVLHCPGSNLKLGSGVAPIEKFLDAKLRVALGTDGAASNNNLNMFEEMQLCALLHKGVCKNAELVSAEQALQMATINGALALKTGGGTVKEGAKADLTVLDIYRPHMIPLANALHNIVYSAQAADVWMNMVDGKVLYHAGEYKMLDIHRVMEQASLCSARIVQFS